MSTETNKRLRELIDKRKKEPSARRMITLAGVKGYISEMLEAQMSFVDIHSILEEADIRVNIKTLKKFISENFHAEFEARTRRKNKQSSITPADRPEPPIIQESKPHETKSVSSQSEHGQNKDEPDPVSDPVGFANKIFETRKP